MAALVGEKKPNTCIHWQINREGWDMGEASTNDSMSSNECWHVIGGGTTEGGSKNLPTPPSPCAAEERGTR